MLVKFKKTMLGELAYFEMGQSPSSAVVNDEGIGTPFLQGNAKFGPRYPTPESYCTQPKKLCEPGDILISVRAPVGDLNQADQVYVIGRGLAAIRFTEIAFDFGWHLLKYWSKDLEKVAQGTTFKAISKGDLDVLEVLLPPSPRAAPHRRDPGQRRRGHPRYRAGHRQAQAGQEGIAPRPAHPRPGRERSTARS